MTALFSAIIALLSLVGLAGQSGERVSTLVQVPTNAGAASIASTLEPTLTKLANTPGERAWA